MKALRIVLSILVIIFGAIAVKVEFGPYEIAIFSNLKYLALFFFLIAAMLSFLIERNNYQKNKKIKEFAVTIVALVIALLVALRVAKRDIVEARDTLLNVSSLQNVRDKMLFEFKTGNDFKL